MIDVKELRIGNWVAIPECAIHAKIKTIDQKRFAIDIENIDLSPGENVFEYPSAIPIPLTTEVLVKCGFKWQPDPYKGYYSPLVKYWRMRLWSDDDHDFLFSTNEFNATNVLSLHQLQNLYFAMTGEELNYTP